MDKRLTGAKIFQMGIDTAIAINENGYICIDPSSNSSTIFNIIDVLDYNVITSDPNNYNTKNIGKGVLLGGITGLLVGQVLGNSESRTTILSGLGAVSGALMGAAVKTIDNICLFFRINDFNNPIIYVPILSREIKLDSEEFNTIKKEITKIVGTLDFLWNNKAKIYIAENDQYSKRKVFDKPDISFDVSELGGKRFSTKTETWIIDKPGDKGKIVSILDENNIVYVQNELYQNYHLWYYVKTIEHGEGWCDAEHLMEC